MLKDPCSETNLDDVLQISNVFTNVGKGEVAKANDLQKAFGTSSVDDAVKEVRPPSRRSHYPTEPRTCSRSSKKAKSK